VEGLDLFLQRNDLDQEAFLMEMVGHFLEAVENLEALQVQAFIVEDPGIVQLFMELYIYILFAAQEPEAGQQLFVQVGLDIGQLLLLDGGQFFEQYGLIIIADLVQGVKKLDDLEVLVGGIPPDIQLEVAFFGLLERFDELE
jgi:hypothetical protein